MPEVLTEVKPGDSYEKLMRERGLIRCARCNGSGEVNNGVDIHWVPYWIKCSACNGSGWINFESQHKQ